MKTSLVGLLFAFAVVTVAPAVAQGTQGTQGNVADATDMQALRASVRADKKALVVSTLNLTEAEAKKFWPIYDAYQRDLDMINRRRVVAIEGLVARDKPVSDLYAKNRTRFDSVMEAADKGRADLAAAEEEWMELEEKREALAG